MKRAKTIKPETALMTLKQQIVPLGNVGDVVTVDVINRGANWILVQVPGSKVPFRTVFNFEAAWKINR